MARVALFSVFLGLAFAAPTDKLDGKPLNDFALRLVDFTYAFQRNFGNQNLAVAPIAVWNIFSLLAQGATGNTFQELTQALRLPGDIAVTQALHQIAAGILRSESKDVVLKGKSAMFVDCTLRIHPEFCEAAAGYGNDINLVDASNTTKLARDINYFICVGTDGRIRDAVKAEFLENLRLILVDALYFKASWTYPFDPTHTKEEMFYNAQGKSIGKVNMMYRMGDYPLADVDEIGAQVLGLPYGRNEQFEMLILLPYDGMPLEKLVNNLASQPQDWLEKFSTSKPVTGVEVYIPRFKISSQLDLIPSLQYTGIRSIFDDTKSELPGVSDSPLFVSRTIQNVEIEVNEEGTVAAASTFVGLQDRLLGQRFEANKEFVFLIMEKQTNLIVFCGVYNDPSVV